VSESGPKRECVTFCRICEAQCGVIATVRDGKIVDVRADKDNPHSRGFMCTKAKAMVDVVDDIDRVRRPLKRVGAPGEFVEVSWDEALDDIARRLKDITRRYGGGSFATYTGNPTGFDPIGTMAIGALREAVGTRLNYATNGEDHGAFAAAMGLQYGTTALFPLPDLWRTDFLLMVGANPWVSKGSIISEPQIRNAMTGIVERGGRVIVVDPRRTETARQFEHVAITPGTDQWLFLGMLKVIIENGLVSHGFIDRYTNGYDDLVTTVRTVTVAECAAHTGIAEATIEALATAFAGARSGVVYGRTGTCRQRFGTLTNMLINDLNAVTGNVNRPGGAIPGWGAISIPKMAESSGADAYGGVRSRTLGLPSAFGSLPSQSLWRDITVPGPDRIRALCTYSANPVSSSGAGGQRLAAAFEQLDLHFSLDLYITESNKYAHYILPAPTFYERADLPLLAMEFAIRPVLYATEAVVDAAEGTRPEWQVLNEIANRMGLGGAYPGKFLRWLAGKGLAPHPMTLLDLAIRTGPIGDRFGLRPKGWSLKKLRRHPHGVELAPGLPVRDLTEHLRTPERRIRLVPTEMAAELDRLRRHVEDPIFPLRVITLRELRSHNSWMHNSRRLVSVAHRPRMLVNPDDARAAGIEASGEIVEIESASGAINLPVEITSDMSPGTIAVPFGWGHAGGWLHANAAGGENANVLTSCDVVDIEPLAGMSILSGIPVRLNRCRDIGHDITASVAAP
jgi:anaerobic selenocysteine-containing dehydrogenase